MATQRGRRRLGRALVFVGVALFIPELWRVWTVLAVLFTPIHVGGQLVQMHLNLNGSAWALLVGWTLVCLALVGWGIRTIAKSREPS